MVNSQATSSPAAPSTAAPSAPPPVSWHYSLCSECVLTEKHHLKHCNIVLLTIIVLVAFGSRSRKNESGIYEIIWNPTWPCAHGEGPYNHYKILCKNDHSVSNVRTTESSCSQHSFANGISQSPAEWNRCSQRKLKTRSGGLKTKQQLGHGFDWHIVKWNGIVFAYELLFLTAYCLAHEKLYECF